jgi:hypothetical protein
MSNVDATATRPRYGLPGLIVAAAFGLLFAYDLWEAIGTAIALPASYEASGFDPSAIPWWIIVLNLLVPPVTFVLAIIAARRQSVPGRALVFAAALAVSAAIGLGLIALQDVVFFSSL